MPIARRGLAACLLVGCAYQPGTFRYHGAAFAGTRTTFDCVDLSVARRTTADPEGGMMIQYEFANRCDRPALIDLAHVRVAGHTDDGRAVSLVAFDPKAELRPLTLDGKSYGSETIVYRDGLGTDVRGICVDAASIVHASEPRWTCFGGGRPEDTAVLP